MTTISVNYDLTAGKSGIPVRTSYYKFASGINQKFKIAGKQFLNSCRQCFFNSWYEDFLKIFAYLLLHCFFSNLFSFVRFLFWQYKFIMLCAYNYSIATERYALIIIFNSNLWFTVGPEIFHLFTFMTYSCQFLKKPVGQLNC